MTNKHIEQDINLKEDANVRMTMKGIGWLIALAFICGTMVVGFQLRNDYRIERLYTSNEIQHAAIMTKLTEMDSKVNLYALKASVENAIVYVVKLRDSKLDSTNNLANDEIKFREAIRNFLK